jgi:hypothetical protein
VGRIETLHIAGLLHHRRRGAAADKIHVVAFGLVLSQDSLGDPFRVAAEEIDLNEGVFLLKRLL